MTISGNSPAWLAAALRCPSCAAPVVLDEAAAVLDCQHCGERQSLGRGEAAPWHDFSGGEVLRAVVDADDGPTKLSCAHCGAVVLRRPGALTTQCSYCLSQLAVTAAASGREAFDAVVPFELRGADARRRFAVWLGETWFAPSDLARAARLEELDSIYVPCHVWRARVKTDWRARVGILTTAAEDRALGHQRPAGDPGHVRTRWEDLTGVIDEPVVELESASRLVSTKDLTMLGGFEVGSMVAYHQGFLGTHDAELPVHSSQASHERMAARVKAARASAAEGSIDAERHKNFHAATTFRAVQVRLALVPVYVVAYRYKGEVFRVLVHGKSGAVHGDHPLSPWKVGLLLALLVAAGIAVVVALS